MKEAYKYSWTEAEHLKKIWHQISMDHAGCFKALRSIKGNLSYRLEIPFSNSKIILTTDEYKPLKLVYSFGKKIDSNFLIYPEDYTDRIGKLFGLKEFEIGIRKFDDKFFIRGNDKSILEKILSINTRNFLLENYISNFKLETSENKTYIELNIVINELDNVEMNNYIEVFKECIKAIN